MEIATADTAVRVAVMAEAITTTPIILISASIAIMPAFIGSLMTHTRGRTRKESTGTTITQIPTMRSMAYTSSIIASAAIKRSSLNDCLIGPSANAGTLSVGPLSSVRLCHHVGSAAH